MRGFSPRDKPSDNRHEIPAKSIQYIDSQHDVMIQRCPTTPTSIRSPPASTNYVKAESMLQLALAIPAGCFIGWAVGAWLDKHFHQEWIAIAGIVLGAVAGFIQIFTTASRYLKNDK